MGKDSVSRALVCGLLAGLAACGRGAPVARPSVPAPEPPAPPSSPARAEIAPRNGLEVIGAMRRAHPSRALRSLAFSVSTVDPRQLEPRVRRTRVYASLPGKHRVAQMPSSTRSGTVRNRQRLAVFERGRRVSTASRVDLAQLLAYDIYAQSIDTTIMWLDAARVRMGIARRDRFNGRRVWVVGASEEDETTPQFWVDAEHWRVVRVIQRNPRSPKEVVDIRFTDFTTQLDVPVPANIEEYQAGQFVRQHQVSSVAINPVLPSTAFDLSQWRELRLANDPSTRVGSDRSNRTGSGSARPTGKSSPRSGE